MPIIFENLVSGQPARAQDLRPGVLGELAKMPASEFSRFLAVAEKGTPTPAVPRPEGKTAGQQRIDDLAVCIKYTRDLLQRL